MSYNSEAVVTSDLHSVVDVLHAHFEEVREHSAQDACLDVDLIELLLVRANDLAQKAAHLLVRFDVGLYLLVEASENFFSEDLAD